MKHKAKLARKDPLPGDDGSKRIDAALGQGAVEAVFRQRALAEIAAADTPVLLALASAVTRMLA